jgi:hypothetical protein
LIPHKQLSGVRLRILMDRKWESFARKFFLTRFFVTLAALALFTAVICALCGFKDGFCIFFHLLQ